MKNAAALLPLMLATGAMGCPKPAEVRQQDLLGTWHAVVERAGAATLRLERHPEYGGSFSGAVERPGKPRARLAGDIDKGEFLLEESVDGVKVSASWVGQVVDGSCGREIRGTWQADGDDAPIVPFTMKKQ